MLPPVRNSPQPLDQAIQQRSDPGSTREERGQGFPPTRPVEVKNRVKSSLATVSVASFSVVKHLDVVEQICTIRRFETLAHYTEIGGWSSRIERQQRALLRRSIYLAANGCFC